MLSSKAYRLCPFPSISSSFPRTFLSINSSADLPSQPSKDPTSPHPYPPSTLSLPQDPTLELPPPKSMRTRRSLERLFYPRNTPGGSSRACWLMVLLVLQMEVSSVQFSRISQRRGRGKRARGLNVRAHASPFTFPFLSSKAPGAILPHIEAAYDLTYIQVSTLFVAATCGFLTGSFLSPSPPFHFSSVVGLLLCSPSYVDRPVCASVLQAPS